MKYTKGTLLGLLGVMLVGCAEPTPPLPPTTGSLVVQPASEWNYPQNVAFSIQDKDLYFGDKVGTWRDPMVASLITTLQAKGWRYQSSAPLQIKLGVVGSGELTQTEIFQRLGMAPGRAMNEEQRGGVIAIAVIDTPSQKPVWSAALQLQSLHPIPEAERQGFSQRWMAQMTATLGR